MMIDGALCLGDCLSLRNVSASLVLAPDLRMQGLFLWAGAGTNQMQD